MGKVYTRFQTKTAQKPYPMGRHISIWLNKGDPPPPPTHPRFPRPEHGCAAKQGMVLGVLSLKFLMQGVSLGQ